MAAHVSSWPAKSILPSPPVRASPTHKPRPFPGEIPDRTLQRAALGGIPSGSPAWPSLGHVTCVTLPAIPGDAGGPQDRLLQGWTFGGEEKNPGSSSEHSWLCSHWDISLFLGLTDWENLGPGTIPHQAGITPGLFIQELRPTSRVLLPSPREGGTPGSRGAVRKDISGLLVTVTQKIRLKFPPADGNTRREKPESQPPSPRSLVPTAVSPPWPAHPGGGLRSSGGTASGAVSRSRQVRSGRERAGRSRQRSGPELRAAWWAASLPREENSDAGFVRARWATGRWHVHAHTVHACLHARLRL